ncbi:MAG TPA: DMT family transporter [Phycisphaerae bacterium]|nr:DMT family transporter [Phycisphaerae bacterium]HRW52853.1 DMT family transporter [Phycisphaerae bacterium]
MRQSAESSRAAGVICVAITLLSWSTVLLFLRALHEDIDGWTANGWRYGMCALGLAPFLIRRLWRREVPMRILKAAIVPALINTLGQSCFGFAVYYIEPGLAGFLLRVAVISATIGAFVLFADERALLRSGLFWGGFLLVIFGSVGTVLFGVNPIVGATATGVLLGTTAGALFGLYGVSVRYYMRGIPPVASFTTIAVYTASAVVAMMLIFADRRGAAVFDLSPLLATYLVVSAILGIAVGHIFYYKSIERLGVAITGSIVQLAPFLGAAVSMVIFDEPLTILQWVCGFVMLGGGWLLLRAERSRPRTDERRGFPVELEDVGDPCSTVALESPRDTRPIVCGALSSDSSL